MHPKGAQVDFHPSPPETILADHGVELWEQIGTPEARRLLKTLAALAKPQFADAARQARLARSGPPDRGRGDRSAQP
jgi:hypothetical protein